MNANEMFLFTKKLILYTFFDNFIQKKGIFVFPQFLNTNYVL